MATKNRSSNSADDAQADRRKNVRYALNVPVTFSWGDEQGVPQEGEGRARDVSVSGAFVFAPSYPPAGASVDLNFVLSSDPQTERTLQMQAEARVLRVEQAGRGEETTGFAVTNQKVLVLRGSEVIDKWVPPMTTERE